MRTSRQHPVITPRLLTKTQAAQYVNINVTSFDKLCPVRPVRLGRGASLLRFDIAALDRWIDSLGAPAAFDPEAALALIGRPKGPAPQA